MTKATPRKILVLDYDPAWAQRFEALKAPIWQAVRGVAISVEHVGSTSVPGLAAKPIIDIDVIVASRADLASVIGRLATLGYVHCGDLGVQDREAFENPPRLPPHHLYVCVQGSSALANHLTLRDHLRGDPAAADAYGQLKKRLAGQFPSDIDEYIRGKTPFIMEILKKTAPT
jgi:GrpB-like predicted nucleotidyltransferase (UPF0157 family)